MAKATINYDDVANINPAMLRRLKELEPVVLSALVQGLHTGSARWLRGDRGSCVILADYTNPNHRIRTFHDLDLQDTEKFAQRIKVKEQ